MKGQRDKRQRLELLPNPAFYRTWPSVLNLDLYHLERTEKNLALEGNLRKPSNLPRTDYSRKDSN